MKNAAACRRRSRGALSCGRRGAAPCPPFIVMDVMEAAAAREAQGRQGHPHGGGPARHAGARAPRWTPSSARWTRDAGLHGGARAARAARSASPATTAERYGVDGGAGAGGRHDRLVGRLRAGVPGAVRRRRQGGAAVARLSLLPPHPDRARPEPVLLATDAPRAGCRPRPRSRRPHARDGIAGPRHRQPRQSDRHHAGAGAAGRDRAGLPRATASGSSPTRSTTA